MLQRDVGEFLGCLTHGGTGSRAYTSLPILQYIDPQKFVDTLFDLPTPEFNRSFYLFGLRYEHHLNKLIEELGWLETVKKLLETKTGISQRMKVVTKGNVEHYLDPAIEGLKSLGTIEAVDPVP